MNTQVFRLRAPFCLLCLLALASPRGFAQLSSTDEERLQILSDPEALKKKLEKEKTRAPFEFFRSQVAPFDILPLVKPNHWSTLTLETRANYDDYDGRLQSVPVLLAGMPQEMVYSREARLVKEQRTRLGMQVMLPARPQGEGLNLELVRPGPSAPTRSGRPPSGCSPHQMLVVVLSKDSTNQFATWSRLSAFVPVDARSAKIRRVLERQRYYRLVLPLEPDKPPLSPHPLTWTTISHVLWDGLPPDTLSVSQQQAMLDWLHWGGQSDPGRRGRTVVLVFRDSFLGPYLAGRPDRRETVC